jgi:hypothetical protein
MGRQRRDRFVEANERLSMTNKLLNPTEPDGPKPETGKGQSLQSGRRENMRSFILAAAIAVTFASFPLTPSFAKSDHPSQTASKPGTHGALSADAAKERTHTTEGDSSDWPPYMKDPIKTHPSLRQWFAALFPRDDRRR